MTDCDSQHSTERDTVRRARPDEADVISELAMRSKAYWKYPESSMRVFRDELRVTASEIANGEVYVVGGSSPRGFYSLETTEQGDMTLGHLFVDPLHLRGGYGAVLLAHACERARDLGHDTLEVVADPNAEEFYLKFGAHRVGEVVSSIPGRCLPVLRMKTQ